MKHRSVIIVGGGIGGLVLARLLVADGHAVTIVERAARFSAEGQAIGFRGLGLQVMDRLGLRERVEQTRYKHAVYAFYTMAGTHLRTSRYADHAADVGGIVVTQRGQLHAALAEGLAPSIEVRFGATVASLGEADEKVEVQLEDGSILSADIVVGADGANSSIRSMTMPNVVAEDFGVYVAMTIAVEHGLAVEEVAAFRGLARMVLLFPLGPHKVSVVIYQDHGHEAPPSDRSHAAWKRFLDRNFADAAEPVRRVFAGLGPQDSIFHDLIRKVAPIQAVEGRVALVGDAGYCPSFFSGNGAGVAAAGAFCLARCLRESDDDHLALNRYQERILPFAAEYHANAIRARKLMFSRSRATSLALDLAVRYAPASMTRNVAKRHYRGDSQMADWLST